MNANAFANRLDQTPQATRHRRVPSKCISKQRHARDPLSSLPSSPLQRHRQPVKPMQHTSPERLNKRHSKRGPIQQASSLRRVLDDDEDANTVLWLGSRRRPKTFSSDSHQPVFVATLFTLHADILLGSPLEGNSSPWPELHPVRLSNMMKRIWVDRTHRLGSTTTVDLVPTVDEARKASSQNTYRNELTTHIAL